MTILRISSFLYDRADTPFQPEKRPAARAGPIRSGCDRGFCLDGKCFVVFIARRLASHNLNLREHALSYSFSHGEVLFYAW